MLRRLRFSHVAAVFLVIAAGCTAFRGDPAAPAADAGTDAGAISDSPAPDERPLEGDAGAGDDGAVQPGEPPDAATEPYAATILASHPVAYWRLNEKALGYARDDANPQAPNLPHPGKYVKPIDFGLAGAVRESSAVVFTDGRVTIGDAFDFAPSAAFSVEMWLAVTELPPGGTSGYGESYPISKFTKAGGGWHVFLANDGRVGLDRKLTDAGIREVISPVSSVLKADNTFHHLVVTFNGTDGLLYLDGIVVANNAIGGDMPDTKTSLQLGREDKGEYDFAFHGVLDEVALYDRALGALEIIQHQNAAK